MDAGDDAPPTSNGRPPLTSCRSRIDDAGARSTSALCAPNPALAGCRMCLRLDDVDAGDDNNLCVFACRIGMSDCPAGQTCIPALNGSRDTQGTCRTFAEPATLGFCR
jgi:hypothetical protein